MKKEILIRDKNIYDIENSDVVLFKIGYVEFRIRHNNEGGITINRVGDSLGDSIKIIPCVSNEIKLL